MITCTTDWRNLLQDIRGVHCFNISYLAQNLIPWAIFNVSWHCLQSKVHVLNSTEFLSHPSRRTKKRAVQNLSRVDEFANKLRIWQVICLPTPHKAFWARFRNCEKRLIFVMSVRLSVCPSTRNSSAPTGRISTKFCIWVSSEKSVEKIPVPLKSDKNNGRVLCVKNNTYVFIVSRSPLVGITKYFRQNCRENKNTFYSPSITPTNALL